MKICFRCGKEKELSEFYKHSGMSDGTVNKCKECNRSENKDNWWARRSDKIVYDRYRHRYSINRIFNHRYSGIVERCTKIPNGRPYSVYGKEFISKEEFKEWCYMKQNFKTFMKLYSKWVEKDFDEKFAPSIDRIDSKRSYLIDNIQWLSKSDNCKKYNK